MESAPSILLIDDDRRLAESMAAWLVELGYRTEVAFCGKSGQACFQAGRFDLAIVDLRLGDEDGIDVIQRLRKGHPDAAFLAITGYASPDTAVAAVRAGAMDLLTKPIIDDELKLAIDRAIHQNQIASENRRLREQLDRRAGMENILSHDYRMLKIFDVIDSVADAKASVLVTGENGTGKSMIARAIHHRSKRRGGPLIEVACGALPDALLESELFGHVAGAYTGANTDRVGKFEAADGGTLFLDEIATATPAMQVKLLRVLQEFEFEPLGSSETKRVDTRVIFATNEDLGKAVVEDRFRQDLFYRINVVNIVLPALRQRAGDIPLLVDHFLRETAEACEREVEGFDRDALNAMQRYAWPGNVRQLENVVERAVLLSRSSVLTREDLPPEISGIGSDAICEIPDFAPESRVHVSAGSPLDSAGPADALTPRAAQQISGMTLKAALELPERQIILQSLRANGWNRVATADALDINRTTLYKKMKRLGLDDPRLQYAPETVTVT
ncbi:MAG: sigma-54 dependent transcriptional regulator [Planctomycetota bacterium]